MQSGNGDATVVGLGHGLRRGGDIAGPIYTISAGLRTLRTPSLCGVRSDSNREVGGQLGTRLLGTELRAEANGNSPHKIRYLFAIVRRNHCT